MNAKMQPLEKIIDDLLKSWGFTPNDRRLKPYASKIAEYKKALASMADLNLKLMDAEPIIRSLIELCEPLRRTQYSRMLQGKGTNEFAHSSKKDFSLNPFTGKAQATTPGDVVIMLDDFANRKFSVQTKQTFDILTLKLTSNFPYDDSLKKITAEEINKHRVVTLTVDEFMTMRGLKDKKEARKQLEQAMRDIYSASLEFKETFYIHNGRGKAKETVFNLKMRIGDAVASDFEKPIKNGAVAFKFTFDLAEYLSKAYIMEFPQALLTLNNNNNPHSYYLGRKLALHYNMNIADKNANRISVQSLLDACPDMPTYDEVMKEARQVTKRMIEPFERDMNALIDSGILKTWEYCNSGGAPLTDEQLASYSYEQWASWLVYFELANYPDQTERIKKIERRKKIAAKSAGK